jgi:putative inorganic carbon (HCO3(-)) transporter
VALLFLILPAPQFADDKKYLAMLATGAFALRLLAYLLNPSIKYKANAIDFVVLAFAAMNVIATAASHYLLPSIVGLSKMAVYFCAYFVFTGVLQKSSRNRSLIILSALLMSGLLVSAYGLYQYKIGVAPLATWEDPSIEDKTTRVYSTLKNPNLLAGYLVPLIPLSAAMTFMALCQKGWRKILCLAPLAGTAIIAACAVLTGSRGGWMGIAAGAAALGMVLLSFLWGTRTRLRIPLILTLIIIPITIALAIHFVPKFHPFEHRLLSILDTQHSSNAYRLNVYRSSFKMFLDSWWIGVGPGNSTFKLVYGLYMRSGFDALGTYCVPLEVAVETGIVGLGVFGWMILASCARAHENFWNNKHGSERWLAAGAAASLFAMMIHGLVDTVYYRPQVQFLFWLLIALCACIKAPANNLSAVELVAVEEDKKEKAS